MAFFRLDFFGFEPAFLFTVFLLFGATRFLEALDAAATATVGFLTADLPDFLLAAETICFAGFFPGLVFLRLVCFFSAAPVFAFTDLAPILFAGFFLETREAFPSVGLVLITLRLDLVLPALFPVAAVDGPAFFIAAVCAFLPREEVLTVLAGDVVFAGFFLTDFLEVLEVLAGFTGFEALFWDGVSDKLFAFLTALEAFFDFFLADLGLDLPTVFFILTFDFTWVFLEILVF